MPGRKGCKNMSKTYKTSQKKRTEYIYYPAVGTKIIISPGEASDSFIELLHTMDDNEVDEQRRYDYRVTTHLDGYHDGNDESVNDRNRYLSDYSTNPEKLLIEAEEKAEHQDILDKLTQAMKCLFPQQKELFKKVYLDKRSNTDIAAEKGVKEAAIRNRLKKMHNKLRKNLS